jgi:hypothetical protein
VHDDGLPRMPADRVRHVLRSAGPRALAFVGTDLDGLRLVATDTDLSLGAGPEVVELPAVDLLLPVTGRSSVRPPLITARQASGRSPDRQAAHRRFPR